MLLVLLNRTGCQAAVVADVEPAVLVEPSAQTQVGFSDWLARRSAAK
jgi:hypothetical protein